MAILLSGFIYFAFIHGKYRNTGARHSHESETKCEMKNIRKVDNFVRKRTRLKIHEWKVQIIQEYQEHLIM